ncbi:hypothetical protein ACH41H_36510 [Streptomyces sp. NPDC020800]|uniref:hypothetical protein n=1 Tax=Streptomyces sp. NPDC020800 TaxID=3365092 RepID=UPI0037B8DE02
MALTRDAIVKAQDIPTETVPVPEWGGDVIVRGLTGDELDEFQGSIRQFRKSLDGKGMEPVLIQQGMHAKLLVKTLVDDNGERLFKDNEAGELGAKSGKVLERLYDVAQRLSGLSEDDQEEMEGNSETPAPDGDSSSSSPEPSAAPEPSYSEASAPES